MLRWLITIQWTLIIVAVAIDVGFPRHVYPQVIHNAIIEYDAQRATDAWFLLESIILIVALLAYVTGSILLCMGRKSGFYIYSFSQAACLASIPVTGYYAASGIGGVLIEAGMMTIGATILYAYLTLVKRPLLTSH